MAKQFDKEAWLEAKQEKLDGAKKALEDGLKALQTSDDWKRMLEAMSVRGKLAISRLSFTNQVLLISQRPWVRLAATFMSWKEHGRSVKQGEKSLTILAPVFAKKPDGAHKPQQPGSAAADGTDSAGSKLVGFRPLAVFGLDQTDGEPLPEQTPIPDVTAPEVFDGSVEKLQSVALALPGEPVAGVELRARAAGDSPTAQGWFNQKTRRIVVVTDGYSRSAQFQTLCHELAHALLHPLGDPHGAPEREVEAESTAYVVCHALGLDTGCASFPYVATWAKKAVGRSSSVVGRPDATTNHEPQTTNGGDAAKMVAASGQRIHVAASRILDALLGSETEEDAEAAA